MYMNRQRITMDSDLDDNSTWRFKLPTFGKYTALEMRINANRFANRADRLVVHPLESCISKIELVTGGSKSIVSLPGQQVDAWNYWAFGKPTSRRYSQRAAGPNDINLFLLGGRGLYDKTYGFDFAKLPETYIEYTYDLNEGDAEYFAADDHDITLYGWRWMGPGEPDFSGYFRTRQLAAWTTTGADVLKTIALPVGNPYRFVGIQAKTRAKTLGGTFNAGELKVNNGEYNPVSINSFMDWAMQEVATYGLENHVGGLERLVAALATDFPRWWSYYETLSATRYAGVNADTLQISGITLPAWVLATTTGDDEAIFDTRGWGFQKCARIGFDVCDDEADLLHTRGMGALDLVLTESAAALDAAVFAQDIETY